MSNGLRRLGQLAENLRKLSTIPSRIARPVSDELAKSIQHQFDLGVNPYGRAWADLAPSTYARGRHWPPLTDTTAMRKSLDVRPRSAAGVQMSMAFPAGIHQGGAPRANIPARQIFPSGVFPKTWTEIIARVTKENIARTMAGR